MKKSVALEITDLKSEFEGGVSFSLDWYLALRQAAQVVIENLNPESLKRVVPIYGGLTNHLQVYYCPDDIRVPSRLFSNDGTRIFDYVAASEYWLHKNWQNKFTIESINGVRFIIVKHPVSVAQFVLDEMNDPSGYAPIISAALITNGDFAGNASGWTLGAGWAYGTNNVLHTPGLANIMYQVAGLTALDTLYEIHVTIGGTVGTVNIGIGKGSTGGGSFNTFAAGAGAVISSLGAALDGDLIIQPSIDFDGTIDNISVVTTEYGTPLVKNTYNVLPGATASLQGTFSDTIYKVFKTLTAALDITSVIDNGVALVPAYWDSAIGVESVTLRVKTDEDNYYQVVSTQDSIGDYFRDGQNMIRFWLQNKTSTGTPDSTNITAYELRVKMKTGITQTVILGKLSLQSNTLFFLEYFSNRMFVDGTSGAWKDTPVKGDSINLADSALSIFHFEACRVVVRKTKTERVDGAEGKRMDTELARAYANYYKDFPSSAIPVSYNISPEIAHGLDVWGDDFIENELPDYIGFNQGAQIGTPNILFADGEDLSANLNGSNPTFTLAHQPAPAASLLLVLNGEVLMEGTGYTIGGKTVTLLAPYFSLTGVGFTASYRYYAGT